MKKSFALATTLAVVGSFALSSPTPAQANIFGTQEVKRWDMCDWENIPENVLRRIENRSDYEDILRRMFDFCPDAALGLTDRPTASVAGQSASDDQTGREPDTTSTRTGSDEGPGNEPESDSPENDSPENDSPENDSPKNDSPENDGPETGGPDDDGPGDDEEDFGLPG